MTEEPIDRVVADIHARTMIEMRGALQHARGNALAKIAVDIVPAVFRNDYKGELASAGERWADAIGRSQVPALPALLVRVHGGAFTPADASTLLATMRDSGIAQAALAVISDVPIAPELRATLLVAVPWLIDTDGLVNLMINANLGVTPRLYETKRLNPAYFR
jgi:hypothetical protein